MELSRRAQKFLDKLDKHIGDRIEQKLKAILSVNPVPSNAIFIGRPKGEKVFRVRIGDYRALYKVKEKLNMVLIAKIDKRPRVYHRGSL